MLLNKLIKLQGALKAGVLALSTRKPEMSEYYIGDTVDIWAPLLVGG